MTVWTPIAGGYPAGALGRAWSLPTLLPAAFVEMDVPTLLAPGAEVCGMEPVSELLLDLVVLDWDATLPTLEGTAQTATADLEMSIPTVEAGIRPSVT